MPGQMVGHFCFEGGIVQVSSHDHVGFMQFEGAFCYCVECRQRWNLTPRGWSPELDSALPEYQRPKRLAPRGLNNSKGKYYANNGQKFRMRRR